MTTEPYLLTPGPLTTSLRTKQSMLRDWGSWDVDFNKITGRVCERLSQIVHGAGTHECVPMQGSGTFSVEAAIGTLVSRAGHVLVPQNGAYCQRIARQIVSASPLIVGIGKRAFYAQIETAKGLLNAGAIATAPRVDALIFGAEDYAASVGATRTPEAVDRIASHYAASSNSTKAYTWCRRAAERAMSLYALDEAAEFLRQALLHLRPEEKEVFLLRQNGELTYEQIAELHNRPVGTVKTQMRSALQKLRKVLGS